MHLKKINMKKLTHAKNLARGAIASLKQTPQTVNRRGDMAPIERTTNWSARQTTTFLLNKAIAAARSGLSQVDLLEFNDWLNNILPALDLESSGLGVHLPALGIFPSDLSTGSLEQELTASIQRLQDRLPEIINFAKMAKKISEDIGRLQYQKAATLLDEVKKTVGYSFWYIESHLALTRLNHGVEKLKHEVDVLSIKGSGHRAFLFYYFGVRNEPAQSALRFRVTVRKVVDESDIASSLKSYLKFRLYGLLESRTSVLANILAYEQNTTSIDLFFTIIKICNLIVSQARQFPPSTKILASSALGIFAEARDALALRAENDESAPKEICELTVHALNFLFDTTKKIAPASADAQAVSAVAEKLSTRGNQLQTDEASKSFINMSWLPIANAIGEIQDIPSFPELVLSNDFSNLSTPFLIELHKAITSQNTEGYSKHVTTILAKFSHIHALRMERRMKDVVEFLRMELSATLDGNVEDAFSVLFADALYETDAFQDCVSICARAGCANERLLSLLPLGSLFIGKRWVSIRHLGPSVDLAIALAHACKVIDDEKLRTFKRYATEELLTEHQCKTIDELIPKLAIFEDHEVVAYFGYSVCDITTIELLPGMGESRLVRHTRANLLRSLAKLHTNRAVAFETEAQSIEDALQVDDGLSLLDDSKVHVDEEAVVNFVSTEYQADFQRYQKLVLSGIGQSESLTDILKYADNPNARIFQIPKNDADDLLVQLTNNIIQRFLYDPASGLDIIIGRRIRHNTISSELRGVLERYELIGTIHHGRYQPSSYVSRTCTSMNPKQRKIVFAANARFSESIDQLVALLRDHYFNVKSRTKPRGVFELTVNPVLFALVRVAAQTCNSLEQFTRECIDSFWMFLSFKLEIIRPNIEAETKRSLKNAFEKFSGELVAHDVDIALISCVQRAAEELQRQASQIASWISVPQVILETRSRELSNTIDIAVAVVSGQVPGFKPVIKQIINTSIELDSRGFGIVSDALYVVIYNVAQHSGKRVNNNVTILIEFDQKKSILVFDITSETAPSARKTDKINKLQMIRTDINKRSFVDGARRNKNSGLYKLAALVHQSPGTQLTFDFIQKDKFNVRFELKYIPLNDPA